MMTVVLENGICTCHYKCSAVLVKISAKFIVHYSFVEYGRVPLLTFPPLLLSLLPPLLKIESFSSTLHLEVP
jgi:hypothetical protein